MRIYLSFLLSLNISFKLSFKPKVININQELLICKNKQNAIKNNFKPSLKPEFSTKFGSKPKLFWTVHFLVELMSVGSWHLDTSGFTCTLLFNFVLKPGPCIFSFSILCWGLEVNYNNLVQQCLKTCPEARTCLENENPCLEKSGSVLQFLQAYLCSFT